MGKSSRERTLADNEAKAISKMLRISPQKLNLVAQTIRGKKVATALADAAATTMNTMAVAPSEPLSARFAGASTPGVSSLVM